MTRTLFLTQLACTLAMTGLIWFVQIVHYPLFTRVPPQAFVQYENDHATRTGWVVAPLMCAELATTFLMLTPRLWPAGITPAAAVTGAVLVVIIWLSTGLIQVPLHNRLGVGYDARTIATLVATNWIRTFAWTARSALMLSWAARLIRV